MFERKAKIANGKQRQIKGYVTRWSHDNGLITRGIDKIITYSDTILLSKIMKFSWGDRAGDGF